MICADYSNNVVLQFWLLVNNCVLETFACVHPLVPCVVAKVMLNHRFTENISSPGLANANADKHAQEVQQKPKPNKCAAEANIL